MRIFCALILASNMGYSKDAPRTADLAKLRDPTKRDAEVARLAGLDPASYQLTQVRFLTAGQKDGAPPLHVLCPTREHISSTSSLHGDYKIEKPEELFDIASKSVPFRTEPDLDPVRESELIVFDSMGKEVRPFGGNNYSDEGYYFDFDHDGILDRGDFTNYGVKEAPNDSVQVFELESIEPKPRTLLEVIFNWHPDSASDENEWGFTCFDDNKDGVVEIAFGPASAITPQDQRKFVFRWDPAKKCYSAGEIPEHSHIRVMKPGETLASIAKAGGLGYPVTKDSSSSDADDSPPPLISSRPPYVFRSLKDRPAAELAAFFQGKERRDTFSGPEDSSPNCLPEKLWDLTPKEAALAIAEANRTPTHRERWKIAIDDRDGIEPPASGWLTHDWGSSGCYSYSSHTFALRFGVPNPSLTVFEYNSIGVVGRNPWADQPARNVRVIKLTEAEARFIADTVFWLDRVRAFSPRKSRMNYGSSGSTADGFATITLYPDDAKPHKLAHETVWATSTISGNWDAEYDPEIFINLAELFIADGIPEKLGARWNIAPKIDRQSLVTPTEERLAQRVNEDARRKLSEDFTVILEQHQKDPIPAAVLAELIQAAGDEALTELHPALQKLFVALPPENAEDREFAALEKRCERDHFGNPLEDEETAEHKKAYARYTKLSDKREFLPAAILRKPLSASITKLRLAENTSDLMNAAADKAPDSHWALTRLHRIDPDAWSNIVASQFRDADVESRRTIFETLAAGNPAAAGRLIANITPDEHRDLIVETTRYHQKHDAASLKKDLPVLMALVRDRKQNFSRRGEAITLLGEIELAPDTRSEFVTLLEKEVREPQQGELGMSTLDSAVSTLTKLSNNAEHLALITNTPAIAVAAFEEGFEAILKMAAGNPDLAKLLADYLHQRFTKSQGMMNDVFMHALVYDLRSLAPDIMAYASESPEVMDGDGADYSGGHFKTPVGQRYHIAREITALWSESDPGTVGRMWVFFVATHPYPFNPEYRHSQMSQTLAELAAKQIRSLPGAQRREVIDSAISLTRIPKYYAATEAWLKKLGEN